MNSIHSESPDKEGEFNSEVPEDNVHGETVKTNGFHGYSVNGHKNTGVFEWVKSILAPKNEDALRKTLEEYVEEDVGEQETPSIARHEKRLIANILKLRDLRASDVMVPRADIIAIDTKSSAEEIIKLLKEHPHSRFPVYNEDLDNILGSVHIKDLFALFSELNDFNLDSIVRDLPIVSPSIPVLDLLLEMRETRRHMAVVIDEFGGIDGLLTIGDLIETIVGEFYDEHDIDLTPEIKLLSDGSVVADARVDIDEFEKKFGDLLSDEEKEEIDTLGGLVFMIARRVPARGEVLRHDSGMVFEIIDADPRRVSKMRIRNIPSRN